MSARPRDDRRSGAAALFIVLFLIYNANGREIGTTDSQPLKFTAREIATRHTLVLDRVVSERPGLAERPAFARDVAGRFRSAYPIAPALVAAVPATILHASGVVDMDAPLASNLIAKLTASLLTATAVVLVFLALRRLVPPIPAWFTALAIGLGTNYWAVASQTLWRHETVAFGTALALWAWLRDPEEIGGRSLALGGIGLALAVTSRQQVLVLAAVMLCWLASRAGVRKSLVPAAIVIAALVMMAGANTVWFGGPLGALPGLEAIHPKVHGVPGPLSERPWTGAAGLLISPSRGLLVFSPVLLLAGASIGWPWRAARAAGPGWLAAGLLLQFAAYAVYSVWWGGHTYGPRYLIDLLVPLAPFLAMGVNRLLRGALAAAAAVVLLVWSIGVAGLGAFVYPNEAWNTSPAGVDLHHERLWDVRDSQIARAIRAAPSPQNFNLFSRNAVRP